jgi:hypothetical protein
METIMVETPNTISIAKAAAGWRVTIGPNEEAFEFAAEGEARRLVRAFELATDLLSSSTTHSSREGATDIQPDGGQRRERLWTVRAYVDAWAIYGCIIAAETAEEAREIMQDNRPAAWGSPEFRQFDHTEFEVEDDEGNTVIEQN